MMHSSLPDIGFHNLTLGYEKHPAVHHLNGQLRRGDMVAVVGPNGAGKSTLLKAMAGLLPYGEGRISGLAGLRVAYLPQISTVDRSFPMTVQAMVHAGLWHALGAWGRPSAAQRQAITSALHSVGLEGFEQRTLDTLSGGQFQRVMFARTMLQAADVVLLDEPFAAVDTRTTLHLLDMLKQWQAAGTTVLVVMHDAHLVAQYFNTTLMLARELVACGPTAEVLTEANWHRARHMHEAFDAHAPVCHTDDEPAHEH